jgi:hypothetical protein
MGQKLLKANHSVGAVSKDTHAAAQGVNLFCFFESLSHTFTSLPQLPNILNPSQTCQQTTKGLFMEREPPEILRVLPTLAPRSPMAKQPKGVKPSSGRTVALAIREFSDARLVSRSDLMNHYMQRPCRCFGRYVLRLQPLMRHWVLVPPKQAKQARPK